MRLRSLLAVALLVPFVTEAQVRAPIPGGRGGMPGTGRRPTEPVPPSAQPADVVRALMQTRSRYSVEAYPLISRVVAPGFVSGSPNSAWTGFGGGTRLDWRLTRYVSWTLDLTSTFLGGLSSAQTAELGLRIHEQDWARRLRPFADLRVGYENASEGYGPNSDLGIGPASPLAGMSRYSRGFGAIAGVGADYSLTNTFALTTGLSVMRSNMQAYRSDGFSIPTRGDDFRMTTYRFAVGIRYNPVLLRSSASNLTNEKMP